MHCGMQRFDQLYKMKIRDLFEAQYHADIMNLIHKDILRINAELKYFNVISDVQGFDVAVNKCQDVISTIQMANWYYQMNLTTPKLKNAYQKLQQAIAQLEEKINNGV